VDAEAAKIRLLASFGIEREPYRELPYGAGIIGKTAVTGETFIGPHGDADRSPLEEHLTVCIPVTLDGRVIAVIALFRMLSHKEELTDIDRELLDLLGNQAGTALYCTKLHAERPGSPAGSAE
jgi:GAF domain-containing protein